MSFSLQHCDYFVLAVLSTVTAALVLSKIQEKIPCLFCVCDEMKDDVFVVVGRDVFYEYQSP